MNIGKRRKVSGSQYYFPQFWNQNIVNLSIHLNRKKKLKYIPALDLACQHILADTDNELLEDIEYLDNFSDLEDCILKGNKP